MNKEEWKEVVGYEGLYKVSNSGKVKSFKYGKEKILKLKPNKNGYIYVKLTKDDISKTFRVHRLVANAFINNAENKKEVNHKDGNLTNNNVKNLEWVTRKENMNHSVDILNNVHGINGIYKIYCIELDYTAKSLKEMANKLYKEKMTSNPRMDKALSNHTSKKQINFSCNGLNFKILEVRY